MRAILSVSDKANLVEFAKQLQELKVDIYSTGGTKKSLESAGVKVHSVSELTGFPEILDGRVKTLHPSVHGGILAKRDLPQHMEELVKNKIQTIDIVVINLYPFVQTVAKENVTLDDALENIDIGGPTMIRAAAKNFPSVLVVVDPQDYTEIVEKLRKGTVDLAERKRLAQKAFQHVAMYDTAIAQYLRDGSSFTDDLTIAMKKTFDLRYGENPHQKAALYAEQAVGQKSPGLTAVKHLSGPELSFNNLLDLEAAWSTATDFNEPTVAIVKHTNPCGLCSNNDIVEAYRMALAGDPVSAFGGIVATNQIMDIALATEIDKTHYDVIIAPGYSDDALNLLKRKKNLRLVSLPLASQESKTGRLDIRPVSGGFLVQDEDYYTEQEFIPKTVSKRQPTNEEMRDMLFAWKAIKHIKSNAIALAKDNTMLGMGSGQPNRVISVELSIKLAGEAAKGAVLASDAMIPFPDTVDVAARGGIVAIIQTGGSVKDQEVIATADKYNMAMIFTGIRHFRH
ncbi:bifunctional phosphoribosylaminoimidazolecarboxamide formyltransferase/IMP cyclohydrolase [Chloroflexota bacterium]